MVWDTDRAIDSLNLVVKVSAMKTPTPFDLDLQFVQANGLRFGYFTLGEGPLALLLHGFPDTPHGWHPLMVRLAAAGYTAVAPFTRGYTPSELPSRRTTMAQLGDDVMGLIEAFGGEAAVLVGHDWGAGAAYVATGRDTGHVKRLVTVGIPHLSTVRPTPSLLWHARHFATLRLPWAVSAARRNNFAKIDAFYRRWSPTWDFAPEETVRVKECFSQPGCLDAAIGYYRGAHLRPTAEMRAPITVPTLTVAGLDDPALSRDDYERGRAMFLAGLELVSLPGGHFIQRESPEQFCDTVMAFLDEA